MTEQHSLIETGVKSSPKLGKSRTASNPALKKLKAKEREKKAALRKQAKAVSDKKQRLRNTEKAIQLVEGNAGLVFSEELQDMSPLEKEAVENQTKTLWEPNPGPQTDFLSANEDEVLFGGGRGGGKSDALMMDALRFCFNKNFRALVIRRTMPELRDLISRAKELYPKAYPGAKWKEMEKMFVFPSGARIEFGYCENVDDAMRYQGQEYTWLGIDEISQYPTDEILEKIRASLRTTDPSLKIYIRCTTNPSGPGKNWVKERWVDLAPPNKRITVTFNYATEENPEYFTVTRRWIQSTVEDNPKVQAQYKAFLASLSNDVLRAQWKDGSWEANEGVAFPEFKKEVHVVSPFPIPRGWKKFRAADWGYSSLAVCLWFAVDYDGNVYVYREHVANGPKCALPLRKTADAFAVDILEKERGEDIKIGYLDSSVWAKRGEVGETPADSMLNIGCRWVPADRSSGSRVASKLAIHHYLARDSLTGKPKLLILSNCHQLIKELGSLVLDENNPEDVETKNQEDHAYDALRYGLQSLPVSGPIYKSYFFKESVPVVVDVTVGM